MKSRKAWLAAVLLIPLLGCVAPSEKGTVTLGKPDSSSVLDLDPVEELNRRAGDVTLSNDERAEAVFTLFRDHLRPGMDAAEVGQVLKDKAWLSEATLRDNLVLGGYPPVNPDPIDDMACSLHLFPTAGQQQGWYVFFVISPKGEPAKSHEDALALLRGVPGSVPGQRLKDFTLWYPNGDLVAGMISPVRVIYVRGEERPCREREMHFGLDSGGRALDQLGNAFPTDRPMLLNGVKGLDRTSQGPVIHLYAAKGISRRVVRQSVAAIRSNWFPTWLPRQNATLYVHLYDTRP